jgi:hypothetical protein
MSYTDYMFAVLAKVFEKVGSASGKLKSDAEVRVTQTLGWRTAGLRKVLVSSVARESYRLALVCSAEAV